MKCSFSLVRQWRLEAAGYEEKFRPCNKDVLRSERRILEYHMISILWGNEIKRQSNAGMWFFSFRKDTAVGGRDRRGEWKRKKVSVSGGGGYLDEKFVAVLVVELGQRRM